jgi:hypothetical protein
MGRKKLFTIIFSFLGGTYIAQCMDSSPAEALLQWLAGLKDEELALWKISRGELQKIIEEETVVPIEGCVNVWCLMGPARIGVVLINIIATVDEARKQPKTKVADDVSA